MSLAAISGKVKSLNIGSNIGRMASSSFGSTSLLRNEAKGVLGTVSSAANLLTDLAGASGMRSNMYRIGQIEDDAGFLTNLKNKAIRAVSFGVLDNGIKQQGVIIDGFDNFKGDIKVALAEQPVMYSTSVTDNRVRTANRLTMRIYVDLVHSDDLVQDLVQQIKDGLGGLVGDVIGLATGDTLNRAQKALSNLQYIQENGEAFKVYTPHKVYDNMMIESISPINDLKANEILVADITFKEIVYCKPLSENYNTPARIVPGKAQSALATALGWVGL